MQKLPAAPLEQFFAATHGEPLFVAKLPAARCCFRRGGPIFAVHHGAPRNATYSPLGEFLAAISRDRPKGQKFLAVWCGIGGWVSLQHPWARPETGENCNTLQRSGGCPLLGTL